MSGINFNDLPKSLQTKLSPFMAPGVTVENAIRASWKGADADKYLENLEALISKTKLAVDSTYDEMSRQFTGTYNAWVDKQRM